MHQQQPVKKAFIKLEVEFMNGSQLGKNFETVHQLASFLIENPSVANKVKYIKKKK